MISFFLYVLKEKNGFWQRFLSCEMIVLVCAGLCPDWESWDTVHRVSNTKEAMQQADDWLGIPQVSSTRIDWLVILLAF